MRSRVLLFASLLVLVSLLVSPGGATAERQRAALRIVAVEPPAVRGTGFRPYERVRVTLRHDGRVAIRRVRATASGRFRAAFRGFLYDRCSAPLSVTAAGASGSRASAKLPQPLCPVQL